MFNTKIKWGLVLSLLVVSSLVGKVGYAQVSFDQSTHNFGTVPVGGASDPLVITIINDGPGDLLAGVSNISFYGTVDVLQPGGVLQFELTHDCDQAILVGETCTATIVYRPTQAYSGTPNVGFITSGEPADPALTKSFLFQATAVETLPDTGDPAWWYVGSGGLVMFVFGFFFIRQWRASYSSV